MMVVRARSVKQLGAGRTGGLPGGLPAAGGGGKRRSLVLREWARASGKTCRRASLAGWAMGRQRWEGWEGGALVR